MLSKNKDSSSALKMQIEPFHYNTHHVGLVKGHKLKYNRLFQDKRKRKIQMLLINF